MRIDNWTLDPGKYLTKQDVGKLLTAVENETKRTCCKKQKLAIRDYFIIDLALATGLRVMEIAALKWGDVFLRESISSLLVRNGKGGKKRLVFFNGAFKKHCKKYHAWKQRIGESTESDEPLVSSSLTRTHMTTRAIQRVFKRCAEKAGLSSLYSIHCLRHTYACFLLKASDWNLRLIQKQLGHSRISTTQVYLDVMMPDIKGDVTVGRAAGERFR